MWVDNINMVLGERVWWGHEWLAQDRGQWWVLVNELLGFQVT
jgi:hypothetical protein